MIKIGDKSYSITVGNTNIGKVYVGNSLVYQKEMPIVSNNYLTFSSADAFTLETANSSKNWDGVLYYSTDTINWSEWNGTQISSAIDNNTHYIYLCGLRNMYIAGSTKNFVLTTSVVNGTIQCSGNIETLLDFEMVAQGEHPSMMDNCFANLFYDCSTLTTAPSLPATRLASRCYESMFAYCLSLINAPSLPATTLADECYASMFYSCSSLTTAPSLPAMTMSPSCYNAMFSSCTSLTTAPSLPATTLASYCYAGMFAWCRLLTTAPSLPATTLADGCYNLMFFNSELTTAPSLPATTLADSCYFRMFEGCKLATPPSLPATTLADNCYASMFSGCTRLNSIPSLPALTLTDYCYREMFSGCLNIKLSTTQDSTYTNAYSIPITGTGTDATDAVLSMFANTGGSFTGTPTINTTYYTSNQVIS